MEPHADEYRAGDRVRVRRDPNFGPGPWPAEPRGILAAHPFSVDGDVWRPTMTTSGPARFYWIVFDEPQTDVDRDGPYAMGEVLEIYLERSAGHRQGAPPPPGEGPTRSVGS